MQVTPSAGEAFVVPEALSFRSGHVEYRYLSTMTVKNLIFPFASAACLLAGQAALAQQSAGEDYSACLVKSGTQFGTPCGQCPSDDNTVRIFLVNQCKDKLEVKLAMQEQDKKIRIFNRLALAPGDSMSGYTCDGPARFYYWARKSGDKSTTLPTDQEINDAYGR